MNMVRWLRTLNVLLVVAACLLLARSVQGQATGWSTNHFEYTTADGVTAELTAYSGVGGTVAIPSMLNNVVIGYSDPTHTNPIYGNLTVTAIEGVFDDLTSLTNCTIPGSITNIGDYAFTGTHLANIAIPSSVFSIGTNAFKLTALTSVSIPSSVTWIGPGAFSYTPWLASQSPPASPAFRHRCLPTAPI